MNRLQLLLDRSSLPRRLLLGVRKDPRSPSASITCFHGGRTVGADQLVLQVLDADEEAELPSMPSAVRFEPEPGAFEPARELASSAASQALPASDPEERTRRGSRPIAPARRPARATPADHRPLTPLCVGQRLDRNQVARSLDEDRCAGARSSSVGRSSSSRALDRRRVAIASVLDREACRVEGRDLVVGLPPLRVAVKRRRPSLGHAASLEPAGLDRVHELAVVARLLPVVGEDRACAAARRRAISALPGPSAPIRLTCWPGSSVPSGSRHLVPGRHRHEQVGARAPLSADRRRPRRARRPHCARSPSTS